MFTFFRLNVGFLLKSAHFTAVLRHIATMMRKPFHVGHGQPFHVPHALSIPRRWLSAHERPCLIVAEEFHDDESYPALREARDRKV
jgi:hypothetical protein